MCKKSGCKKRSSLIRYLATWVPSFVWEFFFPETPRMYISFSLIQEICGVPQTDFALDDSNSSFYSFKSNPHHRQLRQIYNSTPKRNQDMDDDKLKALQQQLEEIKHLVARLVDIQNEQCSGYGTLSNPDQLQKSFVTPLPPPPPPPPPPLPESFSLMPPNSPLPIKKSQNTPSIKGNQYGFPCGKELLKDLKNVQLKKIEKSPGGGPLKKPQNVTTDPGDFLAAVLRKRFGRFQNSPDSSLESNTETSITSGTNNFSYEIDKNVKSAVLSQ